MKKSFLIVSFLFVCVLIFSQENYIWNVVDSIPKSKDVLYNETKVFIAKTWNSGIDVIQIDDKDNGHVLLKGILVEDVSSLGSKMGDVYYSYLVNFYFKENKFKITIDNVNFSKQTIGIDWDKYLMELPQKEYPGVSKAGLMKKSYMKIYSSINLQLQSIIDLYLAEIKKPTETDNW